MEAVIIADMVAISTVDKASTDQQAVASCICCLLGINCTSQVYQDEPIKFTVSQTSWVVGTSCYASLE